jgi:hypothetical protein
LVIVGAVPVKPRSPADSAGKARIYMSCHCRKSRPICQAKKFLRELEASLKYGKAGFIDLATVLAQIARRCRIAAASRLHPKFTTHRAKWTD